MADKINKRKKGGFDVIFDEEWSLLDKFPNYAISSLGRVKCIKSDRFLVPNANREGFYKVCLIGTDRRRYTRSISMLVLNAFDPEYDNRFNSVIHLNNDRSDCRLVNLMRRPRWFALQYHAQFDDPRFTRPFTTIGFRLKDHRRIYLSYEEVCTEFGILLTDVFSRTYNGEWIYPTGQRFEMVDL